MEKANRRTRTSPGLGDSGLRPRHGTLRDQPSVPPLSGVRDREGGGGGEGDAAAPFSGDVPLERAEKISTRRARSSRPSVRVDDVGDLAVAIASKVVRSGAPRLVKSRAELTEAPIDHRDAFVISLLDGKMSVPAIVDVSGMPEAEIVTILERLVRLGIVASG